MTPLFLLVILLALFLCSAYCVYRLGWSFILVTVPMLCIFIGLKSETAGIIFCTIFAGCMGGLAFGKKLSIVSYAAIVPVAASLVFSGAYYYQKYKTGVDVLSESEKQILQIIESSDLSTEQKEIGAGEIAVMMNVVREALPFCIFTYSLILAGLGFMLLRLFFAFLKKEGKGQGLPEFDLNGYLIFALIGTWAAALLSMRDGGILYFISFNAALIISAMYFVQALGIISFFLKKKKLPGYLIFCLILLLFLSGGGIGIVIAMLLTGLGVLDLWADFRKIRTKVQS